MSARQGTLIPELVSFRRPTKPPIYKTPHSRDLALKEASGESILRAMDIIPRCSQISQSLWEYEGSLYMGSSSRESSRENIGCGDIILGRGWSYNIHVRTSNLSHFICYMTRLDKSHDSTLREYPDHDLSQQSETKCP